MGLGPPVCTKCEVIYEYSDGIPHWFCPVCGIDMNHVKYITCLWELEKKDRKRYEINTENSAELKQQFLKNIAKEHQPQYLKLEK